ncbi:MAG: hypothetical protein IT384_16300 [Deltaproteobacteria bacterium]|nr:hypothetical protein [Deltaproteobacteria bacterium]
MRLTEQNLRAFLDRPWAQLRALKDQHTAGLLDRRGAGALIQMGEQLRARAREAGAWPSERDRAEDLASHVRLRRLLDRAGRAAKRLR